MDGFNDENFITADIKVVMSLIIPPALSAHACELGKPGYGADAIVVETPSHWLQPKISAAQALLCTGQIAKPILLIRGTKPETALVTCPFTGTQQFAAPCC